MTQSHVVRLLKFMVFIMMVSAFSIVLHAVTMEETYPFKTGENALVNGVTWTGPEAQTADHWQFMQVSFDVPTIDLSAAGYLAIQVSADQGSPGLTWGLIEQGDRFATAGVADDTKEVFFMHEDGSLESLGNIMFGAVWIPEGYQGALILPMDSLGWQWNNNGSALLAVEHLYITTNSLHNFAWTISVGEVGYFDTNPATGGTYQSLLDLSIISKPDKYYYDSQAMTSLDPVLPSYPAATGESAFNGGITWTHPGTAPAATDTWQTLFLNFTNPVDLSEASYLAIQFRADKGMPGMTWGIEAGNDRYSTQIDGKPIYLMQDSGQIVHLTDVLYSSVASPEATAGIMLIPMDAIAFQFGPNDTGLDQARNILLTTNSLYNFDWSVTIGAIGFYNGLIGDAGTVYTPIEIAGFFNAIPADTTTEVVSVNNYPLSTDDKAFNGGYTWSGPETVSAGDTWEALFVNFTSPVDLTQAAYLAVQYRADKGTPGLTFGVENNGTRYATLVDGQTLDFMDAATGIVETLPPILYSAQNIAQGMTGLLLIPIDRLVYQFGDAEHTLEAAKNFLITTNSLYNFDFSVSIGSIGYYDGDPMDSQSSYVPIPIESFYNAGPRATMELIDVQDWMIAEETVYPFRTGEQAYANGKIWVSPATGSSVDDIQTLSITFDLPAVDMTDATYLAIQMGNTLGSPGLTYQLRSGNGIYSIQGIEDGSKVYHLKEDGTIATAGNVLYSAITSSISAGVLLIPMDAMDWVSNPDEDTLQTVSELIISTNRRYNYNFQFKIGEIGFYSGEIGTETEVFTKIFDLENAKPGSFSVSGSVTNDSSLIETSERTIYGDTTISVTATGKSPENFGIWTGGSYGLVTMTTDTYGDTAVTLKATGSNPTGDAYTAIDIASTGGFSWAGGLGITFWARNDANGEISFNIEVDNKITETGVSDRFNIKQGHRYYLYDVNTDKTSIYMTKPTATLPVGFEGWVRIPFDAFFRADWSNNGVTKDQFMGEGTTVSYLAVTIHASTYLNMEFSLNKFGTYATDPSFISAFVQPSEDRQTIPALMDLQEEEA